MSGMYDYVIFIAGKYVCVIGVIVCMHVFMWYVIMWKKNEMWLVDCMCMWLCGVIACNVTGMMNFDHNLNEWTIFKFVLKKKWQFQMQFQFFICQV